MSHDPPTDTDRIVWAIDRLTEAVERLAPREKTDDGAQCPTCGTLVYGDLSDHDCQEVAPDDEPSEAELIRYYHSGGGEDSVSRQQIRDAGRPGL